MTIDFLDSDEPFVRQTFFVARDPWSGATHETFKLFFSQTVKMSINM